MIVHPKKEDIPVLKEIWREVFRDTPTYIKLFFSQKFSPSSCLVYKEGGQIVSMIHYPQYSMKFYSETLTAGYICGTATLPSFRGKGIMGKLIEAACDKMRARGDTFSVLIPANEALFKYYEKFGFATVFYKRRTELTPEDIEGSRIPLHPTDNPEEIIKIYSETINSRKIAVLQTPRTYKTVISENKSEGGEALTASNALIFAAKKEDKLYVREFLASEADINSLLYSLSQRHPDTKSIIVDTAPDIKLAKSSKLLSFGMAKILNREKALKAYAGEPPKEPDEIEFTKKLFAENAYMNMMLN